jgi:hypothetical protein
MSACAQSSCPVGGPQRSVVSGWPQILLTWAAAWAMLEWILLTWAAAWAMLEWISSVPFLDGVLVCAVLVGLLLAATASQLVCYKAVESCGWYKWCGAGC